jgi:glycosyltransferase involved in cell wall biosynthesis
MRIWILNHYALPPDRAGGTRHYDLGRILAGWGHEVTIFASSFSHFSRVEERLVPGERLRVQVIDGVRFVWIRTIPYQRNDWRRGLNMASYAAGVLRVQHGFARPDVVVGSCVHPLAVAAAYLIGAARRAPFVFEVRDLWPQLLVDIGALSDNGIAVRLFREAERFLYQHARVIITLPPKAADYIAPLGVPKEKIIYIPNGVADYDQRVPVVNDSAARLVAKVKELRQSGQLVAGFIGSHVQANGVDTLVRAARVLHDRGAHNIEFIFVGDGLEKEKSLRLAGSLALRNVLFWESLPKRCVPAVLDALDVTLFSLHDISVYKYGLSCNKIFDYLASGRPIVSSCAIADTPVSASGGGICVPSESPEEIADALVKLASMSTQERHAMGERGKQWVYRHHDATTLAGQFLDALIQAERKNSSLRS